MKLALALLSGTVLIGMLTGCGNLSSIAPTTAHTTEPPKEFVCLANSMGMVTGTISLTNTTGASRSFVLQGQALNGTTVTGSMTGFTSTLSPGQTENVQMTGFTGSQNLVKCYVDSIN